MRPLIIIGAGGHGKVVRDIAKQCGYTKISFLDDADIPEAIGKTTDYMEYIENSDFFIAIGNNSIREKIYQELDSNHAEIVTLMHPNAVVSQTAKIGKGTAVMAGAVINEDAEIGNGIIINTCSSVDHDCRIEDFCHISVGAHLCGTVKVGKRTMVGAGATVINNVDICDDCMIGAGAVVVRKIDEAGTFVGVPAIRR